MTVPPTNWTRELEGTLREQVTKLKTFEDEAREMSQPELAASLRAARAELHTSWGRLLVVATR
jgi:hypothetical protein